MGSACTARNDIVNRLNASLDSGIRDAIFPCGVAAYARPGSAAVLAARGRLEYPEANPEAPTADADTVFDLASLTKIVAALPAALLTIQSGRADLDDEARRFLPELATGRGRAWNGAITLRRLLSHTSGLPAWRPYFILLRGSGAYLAAIADEDASYEPGAKVEYSDLGFMTLGMILERAWDEDLPSLCDRLLWKPLGMARTGFRPASSERFSGATFAPTEVGNEFERGMALAYAEGRPVVGGIGAAFRLSPEDLERPAWRKAAIRGEVHDANCHYGLGGASGHAGLFSTATDLVRWLDFWEPGGALSPALRAETFRRQTPEGSQARGLGWVLENDGRAWHTGFTGTSIGYRPESGEATVALTNRVHPRVADGIGPWRQGLAETMAEAAGSVR